MKFRSRDQALGICFGGGLALILAILVAATASADKVGNASYEYKVTKFDFEAHGQLTGARLTSACTPEDAMWKGTVTASSDDAEISGLNFGDGHAEIQGHGTEGAIVAETGVLSKFAATHYEVTGCDESGSISNFTTTPCTDKEESTLRASVEIKAGVGRSVKVNWGFSSFDDGSLVPNSFECVKPFKFPSGTASDCTKASNRSSLVVLASRTLKLPFKCLYKTTVPPRSSGYTKYGAVVTATGALFLKRVGP